MRTVFNYAHEDQDHFRSSLNKSIDGVVDKDGKFMYGRSTSFLSSSVEPLEYIDKYSKF